MLQKFLFLSLLIAYSPLWLFLYGIDGKNFYEINLLTLYFFTYVGNFYLFLNFVYVSLTMLITWICS